MTEKRKIQIIIDGRNFTVIGTEPEEYVRKIANYVDNKIKEVTSKNDKLGQAMSTTLAALNIADELHRTKERLMELERQAKDPMEKYDDVITELEKSKTAIRALEIECSNYKEQLAMLKSELEDALNEKEKLNQALELKEKELLENQKMIKSLQDKIFDNQIELIETKKELGELLRRLDESKNLFTKEDA